MKSQWNKSYFVRWIYPKIDINDIRIEFGNQSIMNVWQPKEKMLSIFYSCFCHLSTKQAKIWRWHTMITNNNFGRGSSPPFIYSVHAIIIIKWDAIASVDTIVK